MEDDVKVGTYKEKEVKIFLKKTIVIVSILLILAIFILVRACSKKSREEIILESAKLYFQRFSSVLPKEAGECTKVTINEMISKQIIDNAQSYNTCDREETLVKVCKLESGTYHYTPIINCGSEDDTKFDEFKEGIETELISDKSDINFLYQPLLYTNKIKYYYPNNNENKEYYDKAPNEEYFYKDTEGVKAFKWYSTDNGTNYWNNGGFTSEKPDGYDTKGDEGTPLTRISLEKPAEKDYRTIETSKLYRTKQLEKARIHSYACTDKNIQGQINSTVKCEDRNSSTYKITIGIYYTCDGKNTVTQNTICNSGNWSDYTTKECVKNSNIDCESIDGYIYTDKVWKWYISGDFRKYYPSGNASSKEEKSYYVDSPAEGYIKDEETKKTVYKYFKLSDETSETYNWIQIGDEYLTLDKLYESYKKFGFDVKSLNDIKSNQNIDYKFKLEIRNRK